MTLAHEDPIVDIELDTTRPLTDLEYEVYDDWAPVGKYACGRDIPDDFIAQLPPNAQALVRQAIASGKYDYVEIWTDETEENYFAAGLTNIADPVTWPVARWGNDTVTYQELEQEFLHPTEF